MQYDTQKIKHLVPMPDLAERYGVKMRRGMCCCPFHGDKHPSMKIYADGYYCFACGENGDVISWVMRFDSVSFPEACQKLCDWYGIDAELKPQDPADVRKADELNRIRALKKRVEELRPKNMDEQPPAEFWELLKKLEGR